MITYNLLFENGYRYHDRAAGKDGSEAFLGLYQKCIYGEKGEKKYFINFYFYELCRIISSAPSGITWEAEVHFEDADEASIKVDYYGNQNASLGAVEGFFEKIFNVMGFVNYEESYG